MQSKNDCMRSKKWLHACMRATVAQMWATPFHPPGTGHALSVMSSCCCAFLAHLILRIQMCYCCQKIDFQWNLSEVGEAVCERVRFRLSGTSDSLTDLSYPIRNQYSRPHLHRSDSLTHGLSCTVIWLDKTDLSESDSLHRAPCHLFSWLIIGLLIG